MPLNNQIQKQKKCFQISFSFKKNIFQKNHAAKEILTTRTQNHKMLQNIFFF